VCWFRGWAQAYRIFPHLYESSVCNIDTLRSYNGYSYKGYLVEYLGTR
jgi:hypothetical protein